MTQTNKIILAVMAIMMGMSAFAPGVMAVDDVPPPESPNTLGSMLSDFGVQLGNLPQLINYFAYIFGVFAIGIAGKKGVDHFVMGPQNVPMVDIFKYLGMSGVAIALPTFADVLIETFDGFGDTAAGINDIGYKNTTNTDPTLDNMMVNLMRDIYKPMQYVIIMFTYIAGLAFLFIAIRRMANTAQQGAQGPTGVGTFGTFILAAALLSFAPATGMVLETLFGDRDAMTKVGFMAISDSMDADARKHTKNVILAVLTFMIIVGLISVLRGFFMLRGVAEGQQQATMLGGVSHIVAGGLLMNFGEFANIIQNTLGIDDYGILFK